MTMQSGCTPNHIRWPMTHESTCRTRVCTRSTGGCDAIACCCRARASFNQLTPSFTTYWPMPRSSAVITRTEHGGWTCCTSPSAGAGRDAAPPRAVPSQVRVRSRSCSSAASPATRAPARWPISILSSADGAGARTSRISIATVPRLADAVSFLASLRCPSPPPVLLYLLPDFIIIVFSRVFFKGSPSEHFSPATEPRRIDSSAAACSCQSRYTQQSPRAP